MAGEPDFEMKRFALDMLSIKVFIDGQRVEITGTIPVENADVVTKSSWSDNLQAYQA